jgi:hypothetical protein
MKMIYRKLSKTASLPVSCQKVKPRRLQDAGIARGLANDSAAMTNIA